MSNKFNFSLTFTQRLSYQAHNYKIIYEALEFVVRVTTAKKCTKEFVEHVQSSCFANINLLLSPRYRCLRR